MPALTIPYQGQVTRRPGDTGTGPL